MRSTVDLPQPDGPTSAVRLPPAATRSTRSMATSSLAAQREDLAQPADLEAVGDGGAHVRRVIVTPSTGRSRDRGTPRRRCRRGRTGSARRRRRAGSTPSPGRVGCGELAAGDVAEADGARARRRAAATGSMSYSIQSTSAATAQCRLAARPMIVGPPTCGYTAMPRWRAAAAMSMHARIAAADRGVGLEHVRRAARGRGRRTGRGSTPARRRRSGSGCGRSARRARRRASAAPAPRRSRCRSGASRSATSSAVRASWNQYESTPMKASAPTWSRTAATVATSSATAASEAHLHAAEAVGQRVVEVVGVVVGRLLEHRRAGAVQAQRAVGRAEQAVQRQARRLAEDVPARRSRSPPTTWLVSPSQPR